MPSKKGTGLSSRNAQEIYRYSKSKSTYQLRSSLQRRVDIANERLKDLKEAGFSGSQFYREHRKGFSMPEGNINRRDISKRLAEVNRFLASKSSTVKGMEKVREELIRKFNESPNVSGTVNEKNLDKFLDFMEYYRDNAKNQIRWKGTDEVAVDMFEMQEKLQLKKNDIIKNMEDYSVYRHALQNMSPEDFLSGDESPEERRRILRRKYTLQDYLDVLTHK